MKNIHYICTHSYGYTHAYHFTDTKPDMKVSVYALTNLTLQFYYLLNPQNHKTELEWRNELRMNEDFKSCASVRLMFL